MTHQNPFIFLSIFLAFMSSNGSACCAARLLLDPPNEQLHPPMPSKPEKPTFPKYEISPGPAKPRHFPPRFSFPKPEEPTFSLPQLTPKPELAPALPPSMHEEPALAPKAPVEPILPKPHSSSKPDKPRCPSLQFPPMPKFPKTEFPPKPKFHTSAKHELPLKFHCPFPSLQWPNTTWPKVHELQTPPKGAMLPSIPKEQTLPKSAFSPLPQALPKSQEPAQNLTKSEFPSKPEEQNLPAKSVFPPLPQAMPKSQGPAPSDQHQVSTPPKLKGPALPKPESPLKFEFPSSPKEKSMLPKPEIPSFHNPHPKLPKFQQHTIPKTALPPRPVGPISAPNHQMRKPARTEPALTPMPNWAVLPPISTP